MDLESLVRNYVKYPWGKINSESTIQITVGLQPPIASAGHDRIVGLSDGLNWNGFIMNCGIQTNTALLSQQWLTHRQSCQCI